MSTQQACLFFLLDQSASMARLPASQAVPKVIGELLDSYRSNCPADSHLQVAAMGYGTDQLGRKPKVAAATFGRSGVASPFVDVRVLAEGNTIPWKTHRTTGGTPMCEALSRSMKHLESWTEKHREGKRPVVVHVTDGDARDGNPVPIGEQLRGLKTREGNLVMLNCQMVEDSSHKVLFPEDLSFAQQSPFPDRAKLLFDLSSTLPQEALDLAGQYFPPPGPAARGLAVLADEGDIGQFLEFAAGLACGV
jgi:uncharacterized protein YegL